MCVKSKQFSLAIQCGINILNGIISIKSKLNFSYENFKFGFKQKYEDAISVLVLVV